MKNKIIILTLLFLIVFSFCLSSFVSATFDFSYNDIDYSLPDFSYHEYTFIYKDDYYYRVYSFSDFSDFQVYQPYSDDPDYYSVYKNTNSSINIARHIIKIKDGSFTQTSDELVKGGYSCGLRKSQLIYSNFDIIDTSGNVVFKRSDKVELSLNLTVSPTEETKSVPVLITSDWYRLDDFNTSLNVYADNSIYNTYLHIPQVDNPLGIDDNVGAVEVSKDDSGKNIYRYVYKVYKNGTYKFKLVDINGLVDSDYDESSDNYVIEKTITINNIVSSGDTVDNYINGVFDPTPFLSYEYVSDSEIYICTQKFFINELIDLQCYFAKDIDINKDFNNKDVWTKVENPRVFKDQISGEDVYQFYFSVKNDEFDADGTYYVKFYNVFLDKYTWSSIDINFNDILMVDGSLLFKYVSFFRERFGFLVYPFDLCINVLNKIKNIEFEEPAFSIPDIHEPFTHEKIISAAYFNFNDLLENETLKNVHDIYLLIVDVVIVFALVMLLKDKIMGVFDK